MVADVAVIVNSVIGVAMLVPMFIVVVCATALLIALDVQKDYRLGLGVLSHGGIPPGTVRSFNSL